MKRKLLVVAAVVAVLLVVKAIGKRGGEDLSVTAEAVKRRTLVETVSASGKLYPQNTIKISSPVAGEITELNVQEGDTVKKGQVLARVRGQKGAVASPRISLPNLPPGLAGLTRNLQPPAAAPQPTSAVIIAPAGGTVIALNVQKGEQTGSPQLPGSELLQLADMNRLEVRVDVNENNIIKIGIGDSAVVEVEAYNNRKFSGVVTLITNGGAKRDAAALLANDVASYEVHIQLLPSSFADLYSSNRRSLPFRPGMNARAEIKTTTRHNVLSVPVGAVVSKPKNNREGAEAGTNQNTGSEAPEGDAFGSDNLEEVVYVLKNNRTVQRRTVTTGIQDLNYFEITGGLNEGEQVVTAPYNAVSTLLRTGQRVKVVSRDKLFQHE